MERMPVRKRGLSSPGVGVIERVDAASSRSAVRVAFLLFPSFQDMIKERKCGVLRVAEERINGSKISERDQLHRRQKIEQKVSGKLRLQQRAATGTKHKLELHSTPI